ncbi:unnamed protein product [Lasius platythorax]|uniref:Uncharacterized protein n=1 Tax=Lasius platythorax TaxID=488582 RepID=A0AAV2P1B1_9HYME
MAEGVGFSAAENALQERMVSSVFTYVPSPVVDVAAQRRFYISCSNGKVERANTVGEASRQPPKLAECRSIAYVCGTHPHE